jgi:excisionase family DNA binding protein
MPGPAAELMIRILGKMAAGQGVTVIPMNAELTTQQAADLLNVSRPYLVRLLESGQIEFRKVGTHRRVMAESLYDYKRRALVAQKDAADELSALGQEMGLI